ncbi:hypothetical protein [Flammeovirga sp. EKP202]|uniref:hypothetical protein n=1 Tax=Flammeovirga sp. EKP202 TaxID=2770592 RepID=UPI00165F0E29|nr:hypothetical protein [Flammeovirga sp. EKP202]MBD0401188.1 hypothetical protein [Flammeovirga sp. EKP202]
MKNPILLVKRAYYFWKFNGMYWDAINSKKKDPIDSCQLLYKSIDLMHRYDLPFKNTKLEIYHYACLFHLKCHNWVKAFQYVELCIKIDASNSVYFLARGVIHYFEKNFIEAESDLLHSISIQKNDGLAYYHLSRTYLQLCDYSSALKNINKSIGLAPNHAMAQLTKSFCLFYNDKFLKAEKLYKSLVTSNSFKWIKLLKNLKGEEQFNEEFWIDNLVTETGQKRFHEIIKRIENFFMIQPFLLKGFHYAAKKEFDHALREFDIVIKLDSNIRSIYTFMGYIKYLQEDFEATETFLIKAFEMGCTDAKSALIEIKIEDFYRKMNYSQTLF